MFLTTLAILLINLQQEPPKNLYFSSLNPVHQGLSIEGRKTTVYNKVPTKMTKLDKKSNYY